MNMKEKGFKFKPLWLKDFDKATTKLFMACQNQNEMVEIFLDISKKAIAEKNTELVKSLNRFRKKFRKMLGNNEKALKRLLKVSKILEESYGTKISKN